VRKTIPLDKWASLLNLIRDFEAVIGSDGSKFPKDDHKNRE
jgi:hypothetical protein